MYQEVSSYYGLQSGIESFWTFRENTDKATFKILPDGCVDLIFDLAQHRIFLSGIMTRYQNRNLNQNPHLLGIRMKAEWLPRLMLMPMGEFKNERVDLTGSDEFLTSSLAVAANESTSWIERFHLLEKLILNQQEKFSGVHDDLVLAVASEIRRTRGNIRLSELSQSSGVSLRQLERRFKKNVGITLKEFSSIVRFVTAKSCIGTNQEASLLQIAFDMGYYDHAHMNHEFKRIADENPGSFR